MEGERGEEFGSNTLGINVGKRGGELVRYLQGQRKHERGVSNVLPAMQYQERR